MIGINTNKRHNNDRLVCYGYKKETNGTDLKTSKRKLGVFYSSIVSDITTDTEDIRGVFKKDDNILTIESSDFVDELEDGDFVEIVNFETTFIIESKHYVIDYKNTQYMKLKNMSKRTRFTLRGKI